MGSMEWICYGQGLSLGLAFFEGNSSSPLLSTAAAGMDGAGDGLLNSMPNVQSLSPLMLFSVNASQLAAANPTVVSSLFWNVSSLVVEQALLMSSTSAAAPAGGFLKQFQNSWYIPASSPLRFGIGGSITLVQTPLTAISNLLYPTAVADATATASGGGGGGNQTALYIQNGGLEAMKNVIVQGPLVQVLGSMNVLGSIGSNASSSGGNHLLFFPSSAANVTLPGNGSNASSVRGIHFVPTGSSSPMMTPAVALANVTWTPDGWMYWQAAGGSSVDGALSVGNASVIWGNVSVSMSMTVGNRLALSPLSDSSTASWIYANPPDSVIIPPSTSLRSGHVLTMESTSVMWRHNVKVTGNVYVLTGGDVKASFSQNPGYAMSYLDAGYTTAHRTGLYTRMMVGRDSRYVAIYKDGRTASLRSAYCVDVLCTEVTISTLRTGDLDTRLAVWISSLQSGSPQIAFATTNGVLYVGTCASLDCSNGFLPGGPYAVGYCPFGDSISGMISTFGNGFPILVHNGASNTPTVTVCGDALCSTVSSTTVIDTVPASYIAMTYTGDGLPGIAIYSVLSSSIKWIRCLDASCLTRRPAVTIDGSGLPAGAFVDVRTGRDGLPIFAYQYLEAFLMVTHCTDYDCVLNLDRTLVLGSSALTPNVQSLSMQIGVDGIPLIAFYDPLQKMLNVARCRNEICTDGLASYVTVDVGPRCGRYVSMVIGTDKVPAMAYFDEANERAKFIHCGNPFCIPNVRF